MSEDQLKAFLEAVKDNEGLQEQLKAAADADAVVEIAKDAGFAISDEELQRDQSELSDEELEGVAGGRAADYQGQPVSYICPCQGVSLGIIIDC